MMERIITAVIFSCLLAGCNINTETSPEPASPSGVTLRLPGAGFITPMLVDEDNLAVEQTVLNIAVFMADPDSDTFTHTYLDAGFSTVDDYRLVNIPDDPEELQTKDIYVVANYGGVDLSGVTSLGSLQGVTTPAVDKTNNLEPEKGFCMYGYLEDFDFTSGEVAMVYVDRACAKLRITLRFPDDEGISGDNSFLITHAASYTYIVPNTESALPPGSYFNFARETELVDDGQGGFTNTVYVYEAAEAPTIYLYTNMNGQGQEFTTTLPIPVRNHLYDIFIDVYEEEPTRSADGYRVETTVVGYDCEPFPAAGF